MQSKFFSAKILVAIIATASVLSPITVTAEDKDKEINMSQLTCAEFMQMGRMEKVMSVVWYSGWMAQNKGEFMFTPDRGAMSEQKDFLETACKNNGNDLVISQLEN
ncbi:MAG: HdeA/HdeB family chaperone [Xenococcaceae cyanobacterium MO_188.B29]|nr:HdeA/HdeB family chaperone [Xenococcaceae cyanobacterium MO_188.B29]